MATTLASLNAALDGTPYLLPDDDAGERQMQVALHRIESVSTTVREAKRRLEQRFAAEFSRTARVREIYESNAIEYAGPDFAGTQALLRSPVADQVAEALSRHVIRQAVKGDHRAADVLGLHAAKVVADEIASSRGDRPLTEADLRSMHTLIMPDAILAGAYKTMPNAIGGKSAPIAPDDVSQHMAGLIDWLRQSRGAPGLPPIIAAAAAHAWLSHVHPFYDGNGRLCRLLANIVMADSGFPALIVSSTKDRARYIDALDHSDEAGDLGPLCSLFVEILRRTAREMRHQNFPIA